ncbi:MAG: hypothetical protein M1602_00200 [Firmicutes bacterium]|nr:hypothetical protein [Bacillota bacterium]
MYAAVFVLAVGLVLYVVGRPLIGPDAVPEGFWLEPEGAPSALERERILTALAEVENDYQMNKLSPGDYEELKARYTRMALALLPASALRAAAPPQRRSARDERSFLADVEAEAEALLTSLAEAGGPTGASASADGTDSGSLARFCHSCGAALAHPGQRYCQACGQAL